MNNKQKDEILFSVTVEELQNEAVSRIGRKLTDEELYTAQKGIESGLSFGMETIFRAAIDDAVEIWKEKEPPNKISTKKK